MLSNPHLNQTTKELIASWFVSKSPGSNAVLNLYWKSHHNYLVVLCLNWLTHTVHGGHILYMALYRYVSSCITKFTLCTYGNNADQPESAEMLSPWICARNRNSYSEGNVVVEISVSDMLDFYISQQQTRAQSTVIHVTIQTQSVTSSKYIPQMKQVNNYTSPLLVTPSCHVPLLPLPVSYALHLIAELDRIQHIQCGPKNLHIFDRFSNLFHCQNQENICNVAVTKDPTTSQVCGYATLWNVSVLKETI